MNNSKTVEKGDIIKIHGKLLYVVDVNNQGTYRCKDKHGRLVWCSYLGDPKIMKKR